MINKKIEQLRRELKEMEEAYYLGSPIAQDDVYDYKLRELNLLETENPHLISLDSPTQKVGFYSKIEANKKHEEPMMSLSNSFNEKDLNRFFNHCEKTNIDMEYVLEPKIDGISMSLRYKDGYLVEGLSRGDGETGEEVTNKILQIKNIPIRLKKNISDLTVRGEIYITKKDFEIINKDKNFANPRNFVAGCIRLKDPNALKNKKLRFTAYQILKPHQHNISLQSEALETIKKLGFETHENYFVTRDKKEIQEFIEKFSKIKSNSETPYDGLVLKVNNFNYWEEIGYTNKFPKWATAYKYPTTISESKLLKIEAYVGRTGKITYVAEIEPTIIDGVTVKKAILHQPNHIQNLDLRIGDTVGVHRTGEVIPQIIGFNPEKREKDSTRWEPETKCPCCESELFMKKNLFTQYCPNYQCVDRVLASISHFVSKGAADIEGLSEKTIEKFFNLGILKSIPEIYELENHKETIINADLSIKEKLFNKITTSIQLSKNRNTKNLIFGLGIPEVGIAAAELLINKFETIDNIMTATIEEIESIEGIGEVSSKEIYSWLQRKENIEMIQKLKEFGLFKPIEKIDIPDNFIKDKKVVITGKLSIPRNDYSKLLSEKYGAIIQSEVNSKTDYLIKGEGGGSKFQTAIEKKIKIITEEELNEKLKVN